MAIKLLADAKLLPQAGIRQNSTNPYFSHATTPFALRSKNYVFIVAVFTLGALCLLARPPLATVLTIIAASTLAVRQILVPKINIWRDLELAGDASAAKQFKIGHSTSVIINLIQMAATIWVLWQLSR
ncbi:MAG: hypothetical protein AAGC77_12325 [Pseudomonadota bacterium]